MQTALHIILSGLITVIALPAHALDAPSEKELRELNPSAPVVVPESMTDNAIMYTQQGMGLMKLERYAEAAGYFKASIQLNPYSAMSASVYNNLGIAYQQLGEFTLALASFQHAMRLQPNYEIYYKNLIETYERAGDLSAAKDALQAVVADNPENAEAQYLLGLIFEASGDINLAKSQFQRYLSLKPSATMAMAAKKHLLK